MSRAVPLLLGDASCTRVRTEPVWPVSAAELGATRDVLHAPGGAIWGLASNLSEWTREAFEPRTAVCRGSARGPVRDPECPATAQTTHIAVRGGNLLSTPAEAAAALRTYVEASKVRADIGYRCVR